MSAPRSDVDEAGAEVGDALAALARLQAKPRSEEAGHWCEPTLCCFDLAGWPGSCGFQAQKKCVRYATLFAACEGESRGPRDSIVEAELRWIG